MIAYQLRVPGAIENLRLEEAFLSDPGEDEVQVSIRAAGLNPVDYKYIERGHPHWVMPHIPGVDGAGVVTLVGSGVKDWKVGDRVFFHSDLRKPGVFAPSANVKGHVLARIGEGVRFEEAAALPCAGLTAYQAFFRKHMLRPGMRLLIHGGSGGVGSIAIQLARSAGASVITTCSEHNFEYVFGLGADEAIDYHTDQVEARVKQWAGTRGVDVILDTVGGRSATRDLDLLAFNGHLIHIAGAPALHEFSRSQKALSLHKISLGGVYSGGTTEEQADLGVMGAALMNLLQGGKLQVPVSEVMSFEELPQGLQKLKRGGVRGKLVCNVSG